jgi:bifunctional isochorismate lyase/aryl carrier protein
MSENYLTEENSEEKAREWLSVSSRHESRRKRFEFNVDSAALLVLDMQNYFLSEESHAYVSSGRSILPNIRSLIDFFRSEGRPVIFTRHSLKPGEDPGIMGRWWRDIVREDTPESAIIKSLDVKDSDAVIRKTRYSAFIGTDLEKMLRSGGMESIVITGLTTHLCCDSTAREGFMKDFAVFFVVDATATWTEDLHVSSLKALSDGFVIPVATNDMLDGKRD